MSGFLKEILTYNYYTPTRNEGSNYVKVCHNCLYMHIFTEVLFTDSIWLCQFNATFTWTPESRSIPFTSNPVATEFGLNPNSFEVD